MDARDPRSLLSRGYVKEAKNVLKWLRGSEYEEEFQEIKQLVIESRTNKKQPWRSMLKRNSLVPFLYVVVVISVKQFADFTQSQRLPGRYLSMLALVIPELQSRMSQE